MADKIGEKKKPLGVTTQTMKAESKENQCGRRKKDGLEQQKPTARKATRDVILSVQFGRSVVSNSLRPHESQHARPPCP